MKVKFTIPGEAVAKGRPRFSAVGRYVKAYTPAKTANYENLVKLEYERQCGDQRFPEGVALHLMADFQFAIPKSASKKKQQMMREDTIVPTKRPDIDNCIKCLTDGLLGVAYKDDSQIAFIECRKSYSDNPETLVIIQTVFDEEQIEEQKKELDRKD